MLDHKEELLAALNKAITRASLRIEEGALKDLRKALEKGEWHDIETDEGTVTINLAVVVYLNVEKSERGVGFS